jgi:hypothetical protein
MRAYLPEMLHSPHQENPLKAAPQSTSTEPLDKPSKKFRLGNFTKEQCQQLFFECALW